jgi:hypothetical protein
MMALVDLILAQGRSPSGMISLRKMTIWRLRKELGKKMGKSLIETGSCEEYRLTIPHKEFKTRIALTPCFFELIGIDLISAEAAEILRCICRLCDAEEAERFLDGH